MNRRCINLVNSFSFLFFATALAQNNLDYSSAFFTYLKQQNLYTEQIAYLTAIQPKCENFICSDTISLTKASCFYAINDTSTCSLLIDSVKNTTVFSDAKYNNIYVSLLFLQKKIPRLKKYLAIVDSTKLFNRQAKVFLSILQRKKIDPTYNDSLLLNDYQTQQILNRYSTQKNKSPWLAGLLSGVVPGLGKLYIGYKLQALSAFTTNILMGSQMTEAIIKSGFKSFHFIYTCSLFSVFYIANITGSILAVKKKKRDHLNQLNDEIISYYNRCLNSYTN